MSVCSACSYCENYNDGMIHHDRNCHHCDKRLSCWDGCAEGFCDNCCVNELPRTEPFECRDCHEMILNKFHCGIDLCNKFHQSRCKPCWDTWCENKRVAYEAAQGPKNACAGCHKMFRQKTLDKYDGERCKKCFTRAAVQAYRNNGSK